MTRYLLDTNIFAAILRRNQEVIQQTTQALADGNEFLLCPVVFYEVYRGLLYRDAGRRLSFFLDYTREFMWQDFTRADWQRAARLWAALRQQGQPIADADLLIGAFAAERQAVVVTANEKHFEPLGVMTENWLR